MEAHAAGCETVVRAGVSPDEAAALIRTFARLLNDHQTDLAAMPESNEVVVQESAQPLEVVVPVSRAIELWHSAAGLLR